MKHKFCLSFLLLLFVTHSECLGGARGGSGTLSSGGSGMKSSKYGGTNKSAVYNGGAPYSAGNSGPLKDINKSTSKAPPTKRSSGLSAWGIIAIVLTVIFFSVGSYYTFIFYPLICKKERNYDMIELTNV